ncbi:MAG: CHASE2 domain-containing protein [Pyrinomonadaceae bacterium]
MKDSRPQIVRNVLLGFAITALLVGVKIAVEHTSWGHRAEVIAFELLQGQLSTFDTEKPLPVVVVDVSKIGESKDREIIDLQKLKEVVGAIADQKPRAIGIDIVLTPEPDLTPSPDQSKVDQRKLDENYFNFLDFCLGSVRQERKIPIYLGVADRTVGKPEDWLGGEQYREMAATVIIPKGETTSIPIWFKAEAGSEKLISMSAALARSYQRVHLPSGLAWAVESADQEFPGTERHLQEDMEYADALVNYSKLEAIQQNKLLTISDTSVRESGEKFRDRIVIVGDGSKGKPGDAFVVTGRNEPFAGVFLHSAAAYTFAREPMYEFKVWVRFLLDLLLSAGIIGWVAIARFRHLGKKGTFNWHKLQNRLVLVILSAVLVLAVLLVRFSGILWLDFIMVMLALWLHPMVERKVAPAK